MLDSPTSESPFSEQTPVEQKEVEVAPIANNDDFDLGDVSTPPATVEAVVEPVVESVVAPIETPTSENSGSSLDFDLGDI